MTLFVATWAVYLIGVLMGQLVAGRTLAASLRHVLILFGLALLAIAAIWGVWWLLVVTFVAAA